jgi:DNA-binding beta-propeller fold protein YncE
LLDGTSSTANTFTFGICVEDNTGFDLKHFTVVINDTSAYVAAPGTDAVEVVDTTSNTAGAPIGLTSGDDPDSVAVTSDGQFAYVTLFGVSKFAVIDTSTQQEITGSPFSFPATCTGPIGVALAGTRAYFACSGSDNVVVVSTTDNTTLVVDISTGGSSAPHSVAVKPDGTRVYVTLNGTNELAIIDNSGTPAQITNSPFALSTENSPRGIVVTPNGGRAYIAKQNPGAGTNGTVEVLNVSVEPPSLITNIVTGADTEPARAAITPDGTRVYVTLNESHQFAVFDNTAITPALIGSAVTLAGTAASPVGVTVPPQTTTPLLVYIANSGPDELEIRDDNPGSSFPANAASPISLTASSDPSGIDHTPYPVLHFATGTTLPGASAATPYRALVVSLGGTGSLSAIESSLVGCSDFTFTRTGGTITITGTPAAAGTCTFDMDVTDSATVTQSITASFSITIT